MTELNTNELTILKACFDNAQDAAGGDFGFGDEIHNYVSDDFTQRQVAGLLSQLKRKGLIWIDGYKTQESSGTQITFPRFAFYVGIKAGILTEEEASHFEGFAGYQDMNGDPDEFDVPAQPEEKKETLRFGDVNEARMEAVAAEKRAKEWLELARQSCGADSFDARSEQYRIAAQDAVNARLAWLEIRNRFESGE
jgi:hypothetical protein